MEEERILRKTLHNKKQETESSGTKAAKETSQASSDEKFLIA